MEKEKKRYDVQIAGVEMSIISDEREDFVQRLVSELDKKITDITLQSKRCSKLDAAILVALDYNSEKLKAEKRVRNLEAQVALYDANLRRMRDENFKLKGVMLGKKDSSDGADAESGAEESAAEEGVQNAADAADEALGMSQLTMVADRDDEQETGASPSDAHVEENTEKQPSGREEKLREIADLFHRASHAGTETAVEGEKKENAETADTDSHSDGKKDKLRQIESLLRGKEN